MVFLSPYQTLDTVCTLIKLWNKALQKEKMPKRSRHRSRVSRSWRYRTPNEGLLEMEEFVSENGKFQEDLPSRSASSEDEPQDHVPREVFEQIDNDALLHGLRLDERSKMPQSPPAYRKALERSSTSSSEVQKHWNDSARTITSRDTQQSKIAVSSGSVWPYLPPRSSMGHSLRSTAVPAGTTAENSNVSKSCVESEDVDPTVNVSSTGSNVTSRPSEMRRLFRSQGLVNQSRGRVPFFDLHKLEPRRIKKAIEKLDIISAEFQTIADLLKDPAAPVYQETSMGIIFRTLRSIRRTCEHTYATDTRLSSSEIRQGLFVVHQDQNTVGRLLLEWDKGLRLVQWSSETASQKTYVSKHIKHSQRMVK